MKKTERKILTVQVGTDLMEALEAEAVRTGLKVSNLVRQRLLASYGMEPVKVLEGVHVIRTAALDGYVHPKDKKRARAKVGT